MTLDQIIHSLTNSETMKTSLAILLTLALSINGLRITTSHQCQVDSGKYSHLSINPIPTTKKSYVKDLPWAESAHV